jgi:hypothetical protein
VQVPSDARSGQFDIRGVPLDFIALPNFEKSTQLRRLNVPIRLASCSGNLRPAIMPNANIPTAAVPLPTFSHRISVEIFMTSMLSEHNERGKTFVCVPRQIALSRRIGCPIAASCGDEQIGMMDQANLNGVEAGCVRGGGEAEDVAVAKVIDVFELSFVAVVVFLADEQDGATGVCGFASLSAPSNSKVAAGPQSACGEVH